MTETIPEPDSPAPDTPDQDEPQPPDDPVSEPDVEGDRPSSFEPPA